MSDPCTVHGHQWLLHLRVDRRTKCTAEQQPVRCTWTIRSDLCTNNPATVYRCFIPHRGRMEQSPTVMSSPARRLLTSPWLLRFLIGVRVESRAAADGCFHGEQSTVGPPHPPRTASDENRGGWSSRTSGGASNSGSRQERILQHRHTTGLRPLSCLCQSPLLQCALSSHSASRLLLRTTVKSNAAPAATAATLPLGSFRIKASSQITNCPSNSCLHKIRRSSCCITLTYPSTHTCRQCNGEERCHKQEQCKVHSLPRLSANTIYFLPVVFSSSRVQLKYLSVEFNSKLIKAGTDHFNSYMTLPVSELNSWYSTFFYLRSCVYLKFDDGS